MLADGRIVTWPLAYGRRSEPDGAQDSLFGGRSQADFRQGAWPPVVATIAAYGRNQSRQSAVRNRRRRRVSGLSPHQGFDDEDDDPSATLRAGYDDDSRGRPAPASAPSVRWQILDSQNSDHESRRTPGTCNSVSHCCIRAYVTINARKEPAFLASVKAYNSRNAQQTRWTAVPGHAIPEHGRSRSIVSGVLVCQ